jgi:hypothetical protein
LAIVVDLGNVGDGLIQGALDRGFRVTILRVGGSESELKRIVLEIISHTMCHLEK